jgi:hypothetical protein
MAKDEVRMDAGGCLVIALTILFIVLKLTNVISWSWVWVLSPLWISFTISFVFVLFLVLIVKALEEGTWK